MVLKRKEVVAAALVVLIGVAGYLNWSYQDTVRVSDGEEYIATGKRLGEAQLVSSNETVTDTNGDYFSQARQNRETAREKSLDILNQTATNQAFDENTRKKAQEEIMELAEDVQREATVENLIKAKGYVDVSVYLDDDKVEIVVKKDGFTDQDAAKISAVAVEQMDISPNAVKIIPVK